MAVPLVIPDASVLLKWVLRSHDEDRRDRALALKDAWLAGSCRLVIDAWPLPEQPLEAAR